MANKTIFKTRKPAFIHGQYKGWYIYYTYTNGHKRYGIFLVDVYGNGVNELKDDCYSVQQARNEIERQIWMKETNDRLDDLEANNESI